MAGLGVLGNSVAGSKGFSETRLTLRAKVGRQLLKHLGRREALTAL